MAEFIFRSEQGERDNQEDAYGNFGKELFVVADGASGRPAGEIASELAISTIIGKYELGEKNIEKLLAITNRVLSTTGSKKPPTFGMVTTAVIAQLKKDRVLFANTGDSRGYIFSGGKLMQSTYDHRLAGFLISALGSFGAFRVHRAEKKIKQGDLVLLSTDGLTDFVQDKVIEKILASDKPLRSKADGLIEVALQFGSTDNITVGLIKPDKA